MQTILYVWNLFSVAFALGIVAALAIVVLWHMFTWALGKWASWANPRVRVSFWHLSGHPKIHQLTDEQWKEVDKLIDTLTNSPFHD